MARLDSVPLLGEHTVLGQVGCKSNQNSKTGQTDIGTGEFW